MNNIETRQFATELRMVGDRKLEGYAAKFGELSHDLGGFREQIKKGAFRSSIKGGDIRAFWNHDMGALPLGRTKSGTLQLKEDDEGLRFAIELPQTQAAQDLITSVARGDVDGVSFGFLTKRDKWQEGGTIRTLLDVELIEISPVNYAAYGNSDFSLALRSQQEFLAEQEERAEAPPEEETPFEEQCREDEAKAPEPVATPKRNVAEAQIKIARAKPR